MRRKLLAMLLIVAMAGLSIYGIVWWLGRDRAGEAAGDLVVLLVRRGTVELTVTGSGTLMPGERRVVRAEVGGKVERIFFEEGIQVAEGDILVELVNDDLEIAERQAQLDLIRAQRELSDFLAEIPGGSPYLTSPIDGLVREVTAVPGESVREGQVLAIVEPQGSVFQVHVTPAEAVQISAGDRVEMRFAEFSGALEGRVREVADYQVASADGRTWVTPVWVDVGGGQLLRAGMTADAWIHTAGGTIQRSGVGLAPESVRVTAMTDGRVEQVYVREGSVVAAGERLVGFSETLLQEARQSRELAVEVARSRLRKATGDRAALRAVSLAAGTVVRMTATPGEAVRVGDELAVVSDLSVMELAIDVDELDIAGVRPGMPVQVTVEAAGDAVYDGEVIRVALEGDAGDGVTTFAVTIRVSNPEGALRSGMTGEAVITIDRREGVLVVPAEAVQVRGNTGTVRVLIDGQAVSRLIEVGIAGTRLVEVIGGLQEGDRVALAAEAGAGQEQLLRLRGTMPMLPGMGQRQTPNQPSGR
ncbi:MAG TPA: efflux RND transporter periplasmic adaptor subunit [Bacillota bacterium]|nr:efflux RND transporter periplasmic adaptor subunit [Bacillota bacterium]